MSQNNQNTSRRAFIKKAAVGTAGVGIAINSMASEGNNAAESTSNAPAVHTNKTLEWKLITSWPKNFPGLGTMAKFIAERVTTMSAGRLTIKLYGAGEIAPALGVFDAVSRGAAEMGHAGAYYWRNKHEASQFFSAVPFGLTALEMNAWLHFGGGLKLWRELYADFNLYPLDGGNTGVQMGGWYNKTIDTLDDVKGLKMRIPGLGGEVFKRAGGIPVTLPGGELFTALKTGSIDATEWVGPYNDLAFGLHKAAKYYYYPGWHEPGPSLELTVNKTAWEQLPTDLQIIVDTACRAAFQYSMAEYTARNNRALNILVKKHKVDLRRYPDDVLAKLKQLSAEVVEEIAEQDAVSKKVYDSYLKFRNQVVAWHDISERAYLNARA